MKKLTLISALLIAVATSFAQRGKNGNYTVNSVVAVNEYTTLTADVTTGGTSVTVANSGLNAKGRFTGNLSTGDLVMIIQMQGATINGMPEASWQGPVSWGIPRDSSWGAVTAYNNCGNYEFAQVSSVPNATTINLDCGLTNNYTAAGRVQVIRVPRYMSLTINSGDSIIADGWDSAKGGVVAIEVLNNTIINSGGSINVSGEGFRGAVEDSNGATYGVNNPATSGKLCSYGKSKGEGIAGYGWSYDQFGGRNCKGAPANGGGGGNAHNAGGGGGANGGVVANWIDGIGDPDVSTANNIAAWNLEYSWFSGVKTRSGGGRGGYTFSANNLDPTKNGPNNNVWAGDNRASQGGLGGRPLDYSTGKIFMGGGGGAGDQDDNYGGVGGNGGGIVFLLSYGTVSGGGKIMANGANGGNAAGAVGANSYSGKDGAGGAGGGGTIIINSTGNISGISVVANGGTGGNQVMTKANPLVTIKEAEGPGGGGGGGHIATSNSGFKKNASGGANGTTNSPTMAKFPANGATMGGEGDTNVSISGFQIVTKNDDTICSGQSATLSATLTGTVPSGTSITWYSTITGGSSIFTGSPFVTPALTKDTVFYVSTCPGTYRQAVNVIISGSSAVSINPPATICSGSSTNLSASGGTAYSWAPAASLSNPAVSNPVASPTVTTTYTVSITTPCGKVKDSVVITVTPAPVTTASAASSTICPGNSTTLTATGGTAYSWSPSTGLSATTGATVTANPTTTQTYSVLITTSCPVTRTIVLTVNPTPTITPSGPVTICSGNSTTLSASGTTTYSWAPSIASTSSTVSVSPSTTTTYTVTGTSNGCTSPQQTITITVNPKPAISINPPAPGICSGGSVNLAASGASTYTWTPNTSLSATTGANVTANPGSTITYTIIGTSAAGCLDTTNVTVTVSSSLIASISGKDTICSGGSTTLTASGGTSYVWSGGSTATTSVITISPTSNTTYTVTVSNSSCPPATASITVIVNPAINPKISGINSICAGGATTLTASGGNTYQWSGGSTATTSVISVSPVSTTTYSVQISNGTCVADTSVIVTVNAKPIPTVGPAQSICPGTSASLIASGGISYAWLPSASLNNSSIANPIASPASTTVYTVTVTNGSSCSASDSVKVTVDPTPAGAVCCNATIIRGQSTPLTITSTSTGETYLWSPAIDLTCSACPNPIATPTTTTTYYVTIKDSEGCSKKDSVTIIVQENCGQIFIPKAFSPNNDGQNDVLLVRGNCIKTIDFLIFDRWGNKVFESTDQATGWDGTYKGKAMDAGTYVYYFNAVTIYNNTVTEKGNVTLVR